MDRFILGNNVNYVYHSCIKRGSHRADWDLDMIEVVNIDVYSSTVEY